MLRKASRSVAFGSLLIVLSTAGSAMAAPDAHAVADAFVATFGATGKATASYAEATASGDTITITGFKATQPDRAGREIDVPTIVISGAADRQPGGFTATHIVLTDGSATTKQNKVAWQTATVDDAVIPTVDEIKAMSDTFRPFSKASITGISISAPELAEPIAVGQADVSMGADASGHADSMLFTTTGIVVPASALDAPEVQGMMQELGYTDLHIATTVDVAFDSTADTFTLRSFGIDVTDIGKLVISGKFSRVKVHGMIGADGAKTDKTPPMLDGLTIRLDNAGVVENVLAMQAKQLQTTPDVIAGQWPMLLMLFMGDTGGMAFQEKVQTALTTFLQSPKSLTITMAPAEPVPFDKVLNTLAEDRNSLPDLLAVDITANN